MTKRCKSKMKGRGRGSLSPYAKARKVPHRYSDTYHEWRNAITRGDEAGAERASAAHYRKFGGHNVNA